MTALTDATRAFRTRPDESSDGSLDRWSVSCMIPRFSGQYALML